MSSVMFIEFLTVLFSLRASPVISIKKEIKFSPKEIDLTKKNCGTSFWSVDEFPKVNYCCLSCDCLLINYNVSPAWRSRHASPTLPTLRATLPD